MHAAAMCPFAAAFLIMGGGCGRTPRRTPPPVPAPAPAVDARATSFEAVVPDGKGGRIAVVRGGEVSFGDPSDGTGQGRVAGTRATLYRDGRAVAEVRADRVRGDSGDRTVSADGHVEVRAGSGDGAMLLRSDTMRWRADTDELTGSGNVLLRQAGSVSVPAVRFRADARLRRVELFFVSEPATGRIETSRSPKR